MAAIATSGHGARTTSPRRSWGSQRSALDWKPLGRRIVDATPASRTAASESSHMRVTGLSGRPPTTQREVSSTTCSTPARSMRRASCGMSPQPPSRNTARAPSRAGVSDSGRSRSPWTTSTPAGQVRRPGRVAHDGADRLARAGERGGDLPADGAGCARDQDHRHSKVSTRLSPPLTSTTAPVV